MDEELEKFKAQINEVGIQHYTWFYWKPRFWLLNFKREANGTSLTCKSILGNAFLTMVCGWLNEKYPNSAHMESGFIVRDVAWFPTLTGLLTYL